MFNSASSSFLLFINTMMMITMTTTAAATAAAAATATATAAAATATNGCIDNAMALQQAIDDIPRYPNPSSHQQPNDLLWLCPGSVIETDRPFRIIQRTVTFKCAGNGSTTTSSSNSATAAATATATATDDQCIIRASASTNTRLFMLIGGFDKTTNEAVNTVIMDRIHFQGGSVDNANNGGPGGAAVYAQGMNLVVTHCHFTNNAAAALGGAIAVNDVGRTVSFLLSNTSFQNNIDIEIDIDIDIGNDIEDKNSNSNSCHSLYWNQQHPNSAVSVEMNTVQWDNPTRAQEQLQSYQQEEGTVLCF